MINQQTISAAWYQGRWWWRLLFPILLPLSWLFTFVAGRRRNKHVAEQQSLSVPVLVVGNIAVGGTGKTPLLISLCRYLQQQGLRPGIVSRGYGGQAPYYPFSVSDDSEPNVVGDEPLLIRHATQCPVMIGADRYAVSQALIEQTDCNVILSDDGLQHYRLPRDFEICVMDGQRLLGNGYCLPAGPLREPAARLDDVQLVVVNGESSTDLSSSTPIAQMQLRPSAWVNVKTGERLPLGQLPASSDYVAVSGIGNPQRFFETLTGEGIQAETKAFDDHHPFQSQDFEFAKGRPVLMTAKDAIKCRAFALPNWWYLEVEAELDTLFFTELTGFVESCRA